MRDTFLMLAADTALRANRPDEAERLRQRLLRSNPDHMLKAFVNFEEAAREPDLQAFLDELRMRYPAEIAQEMLESMVSPGGGDDDYLGTLITPGSSDAPQTLPPQKRTKPGSVSETDFGEALGNEMEEAPGTLMPQSRPPAPPPPPPAPAPAPPEDEPVVYRVHPE